MSPLLALALLAPPKDLAEYLKAHPWNAAQDGPLLVLEPERARAAPTIAGIGSFGRKKAAVGGLTALVPPTRIDIDDSLSARPNLYEGLPADAKVLYLLRSLSEEQWRIAGGRGIGLADLRGEQSLVFESLLPKRFAWRATRLDDAGFWGEETGKGTLGDAERAKVRLRVERTVQMAVFLRDRPNAQSSFGTDRYHGAPGSISYNRDEDDEYVPKGVYGMEVRKEVPNLPKPSQLDTKGGAFDAVVAVPARTTVGEILRSVGPRAGVEIVPDFRVADRLVAFYGGRASARDLLAALALSVEGTYRRVGSAYVLTSDLTGMGARKLRLALWEDRLRRDSWRTQEAWRHEIGTRDGLAQVGFGTFAPEIRGSVAQALDQGDRRLGAETKVDASSLGPKLRRFLDQWDSEYRSQPILKDKVGLSSSLAYRYVLPDGRALGFEGGIGPLSMFLPRPKAPERPADAVEMPAPPYAVRPDRGLSVLLSAEDPKGAEAAVRSVGRFPGSRLWLDTHSKAALDAALRAAGPHKVEVGLALRPWRAPTGEPDRNVAGEFGPGLRARLAEPTTDPWQTPVRVLRRNEVGTWMAPSDPSLPSAWRTWGELAATSGLAGVMLRETEPFGYEPQQLEWQSRSNPTDWTALGHGYTAAQRLAFLRREGIDPIDIADQGLHTTPDLRQTFFFDDALRGSPSVYDGTDDTHPKTRTAAALWRKAIAEANRAAVERLANAVGRPLWFEQRFESPNAWGQSEPLIVPWKPGEPLPSATDRSAAGSMGEFLSRFRLDPNPGGRDLRQLQAVLVGVFSDRGAAFRSRLLLDLSDLPPDGADAVLRRWLKGV